MIHRLIREYLAWQRRAGRTEATIATSRYNFSLLIDYMLLHHRYRITRPLIRDFIHYLFHEYVSKRTGRPLSDSSKKRIFFTIYDFTEYLRREKRMFLKNPAGGIKPPQPSQLPRDIPPDKTIQNMIDTISPIYTGIRDKAILETLYSTAIRARELIRLDIYDVDFKEKIVRIRQGKGRKDRVVPLGTKCFHALKIYADYWRRRYIPKIREDALFISRTGARLSYGMLLYIIAQRRGDKRIRPHTIRHACAIEMLKNGADIRYIQEMLGHASIESTQIYTRLLPIDIKKMQNKYHPRKLPNSLKNPSQSI